MVCSRVPTEVTVRPATCTLPTSGQVMIPSPDVTAANSCCFSPPANTETSRTSPGPTTCGPAATGRGQAQLRPSTTSVHDSIDLMFIALLLVPPSRDAKRQLAVEPRTSQHRRDLGPERGLAQ